MSDANIIGNFTDAQIDAADDAAHSAVLGLHNGEYSLELPPFGREIGEYQAQGVLTGLRKEARAFAKLSVQAQATTPLTDFSALVHGLTSGFVSTTADIGDVPTVDLTLDRSYGTSSRVYVLEDCRLESFEESGGSPSTVSMTFTVYGKITATDAGGSTKTLVAGR